MHEIKKIFAILLNILIPVISILAFVVFFPVLFKFFFPFIAAWIIACIANPLVKFLESKIKLGRKHGSALIIIFVLFIIVLLFYLLFSWIWIILRQLVGKLPALYDSLIMDIDLRKTDLHTLLEMLPPERKEFITLYLNGINESIKSSMGKIAMPTALLAGDIVIGISSAFVYTIIIILAAYFFIVEMNKIKEFIKRHTPGSFEKYRELIRRDVGRLVRGYFMAQLKILLIVTCIVSAGLLIMRVRFALPIAILISLLDFLPIFGTGTIMIPWALLKLISGKYMYAGGLVIIYVITQAVRQILQPKLMGDSMGMPALYTLFCLFIGFRMAGIGGMLLAIPFGMVLLKLYEYGVFNRIIANLKLLKKEIDAFRNHYAKETEDEGKE